MSAELTDAEQNGLMVAFLGAEDDCAHNLAPLFAEVRVIVKAREAAARREALLEAAEEMQAEKTMPFWSVHVAALRKRAALAEPERDEEGGMLGGIPGFKHLDATVPTDGEQPEPSDEEGGR